MLKLDLILDFCERTKFFTSRPNKDCIIEAVRLDSRFGSFIKNSMVSGIKYTSAESFIDAYKAFFNIQS